MGWSYEVMRKGEQWNRLQRELKVIEVSEGDVEETGSDAWFHFEYLWEIAGLGKDFQYYTGKSEAVEKDEGQE